MKKKYKKINYFNTNQRSFYFEDYLETNKRNKSLKKTNDLQDRIYLVFFFFLSLIFIFCIKIIHISLSKTSISNLDSSTSKFILERRDIIDRNGILISRNINSYHAAIVPRLVKDKINLILKIRLNFPELKIAEKEDNFKKKNYLY